MWWFHPDLISREELTCWEMGVIDPENIVKFRICKGRLVAGRLLCITDFVLAKYSAGQLKIVFALNNCFL